MGFRMSSDDDDPDDERGRSSNDSEEAEDGGDADNLTGSMLSQIIKQSPLNRVARMSTMESGTSPSHESTPSRKQLQPSPLSKQQHQPPLSQSVSLPLNADSATADVEAEKTKKLLEWELSSLEADDLRSHAWYHGQLADRNEAERLLRQCVSEEYGSATATIISANGPIYPPNNTTATVTKDSSLLKLHVEGNTSDSDGMEDVSSESSDADFGIDDSVDERGMDPSVATSTTMAAALQLPMKRPKRPRRPRRHFYCFLVRDSLNVRPPGRYVVSCLRVDKYEDLETGDKNKSQRCHDDEQRRNFRRHQRRQRRQHRHPVLHFVVNEIILQPGTVYERSQFSFGETLPSLTTAISTAVVNNNEQRQCQPGFDSVPDLIRYYVGGADDNAVLSYGGGNDGTVSGSMTLSRTAQTEVRIRYPCNRRRPLMTENSLAEAASPNIPSSTMESSRLMRQRCSTSTTSVRNEGQRVLSTLPGRKTEASSTIQVINHRRQTIKSYSRSAQVVVQSSSSMLSTRRPPSATVTSAMVASATSLKPSAAAESPNQTQSQLSTLSPCPSRVDLQSSITDSTSLSPGPSVKTLPQQPKSSYPFPPTSGSSSSLSSERPSTSGSTPISFQSGLSLPQSLASSSTPHLTISDLLSSPSSSIYSSRPSQSLSRTNLLNSELNEPTPFGVSSINAMETNESVPTPAINRDSSSTQTRRDLMVAGIARLVNHPIQAAIMSPFFRVRVRNGYRSMLNRLLEPDHVRQQSGFDSSPSMSLSENSRHSNDGPRSRSASNVMRSERHQVPSNSENTSSGNENDNDEQNEQRSSSFNSSSISTSTLKDQEIERNRDRHEQLTNHHNEEHIVEQPQKNERQFTGRQVVNSQRKTQVDEVQEAEVRENSVEKEHVLDDEIDSKEDQKQSDGEESLEPDSIVEKSSEASENQNFRKCRTRWINTMRQGLVDMLEQPFMDHQNRKLTRITGTQDCDPRQRGSRQTDQTLIEDQEVNHTTESMETELHRIILDTETKQLATLTNQRDRTVSVAPAQTCATRNSIRLSNNDLAENMIRQWAGLQRISNRSKSFEVKEIYNRSQIPLTELLPRIRRQQRQNNRLVTGSGNPQLLVGDGFQLSGEYLRGHVTPPEKVQVRMQMNMNYPQVIRDITGHSIINQEGNGPSMTKAGQSNTVGSNADTSSQEIGTCSVGVGGIGCKLSCDYVNINPLTDDFNNSYEKNSTESFNINNLDTIHLKSYQHLGYKQQVSKQQSNNNYKSFVDNNIEVDVDYENIITHNTEDTNDFNYENIGQNNDEKRQLINDCNGGSTPVSAALRAVHLAIIGDPDEYGGTTVGSGRLAAALCHADGRATVLPYRQNFTESEQVRPLLNTCPLQLLGQPGPAGRRARLDVIERFACLQYLVAMTVIVTPCLLLIGSDINDKENLADENLEWSLEDEYEYRRRRFYYRCAGISSWCVSDNNSTSDDDDESYKLTANSDFDSGYSLPPREEWAIEKRHWLDLLTRHRAAALDKWIRTAADAKQAVGDVYGYRALMSALCSDRIQSLQDAWATLRRLHTDTAVAFESRLRPEFLGRREKTSVAVLGKPGINDIDDNDVNELLQLPPNATVPDATALAVLYEHLYNDNNSNTSSSFNTTAASLNDIGSKKEKDPRLSSFFTSPLLLSPSPWSSPNSGISGGLGSSVASDYGLSALHVQCIHYSEWVQQNYGNDDSILPLMKPPMLQLDRFRSNFRALLHQYSGSSFDDYDDGDERFNFVLDNKDENFQNDENISYHKEIDYNRNDEFAYERQYEDNVEKYGTSGADYDDCGDDDDDDATVICCNNSSSLSEGRSVAVDTMCGDSHVGAIAAEKQRQTTKKNEECHPLKPDQEEDRFYRWIEDVSVHSPGPAPLNIVFCTELHVRLFWPPTLFLQDVNDDKDSVDHRLAIPAYALGTTYVATATAIYNDESESTNHVSPTLDLNHVIVAQLDQAAQDMRLRYKAMDDFLDRACAYSTLLAKVGYEDNTMVGKQQQRCMLSQCV